MTNQQQFGMEPIYILIKRPIFQKQDRAIRCTRGDFVFLCRLTVDGAIENTRENMELVTFCLLNILDQIGWFSFKKIVC